MSDFSETFSLAQLRPSEKELLRETWSILDTTALPEASDEAFPDNPLSKESPQ